MSAVVDSGARARALLLDPARCAEDDPRLGGKGRNLLRLVRGGLPVPPFHCISAEAHDLLVRHFSAEIDEALAGLDYGSSDAVEAAARKIQRIVRSGKLPEDLEALLSALPALLPGGDIRRSVRSSAQAEDGVRDSYAGQFESYLGVPRGELRERIRDCWASAFGARLLHYLNVRGRDPRRTRVAVVLQQMVESAVSGVLFTEDPAGQRDAVVIAAGLGLGEGVVSDRVETDSFWVGRRDGRLQRVVRRKTGRIAMNAGAGGTELAAVSEELAERPALDDAQVCALAAQGLRIERLCGASQDIEWSFDRAGKLYILQTRPITTLPRGEISLFDNSNIVEGYPGITLPLTFSFVRGLYETIFRAALRRMGVAERTLTRQAHVFRDMIGYVEGHLYYVLSSWYPMLRLLPGADRLVPAWEESVGIREGTTSGGAGAGRLQSLAVLRIAARVGFEWLRLGRSMRRLRREFERTAAEIRSAELERLDSHALAGLIEDTVARLLDGWDVTILNDFFSIFFSKHSRSLLERVPGGKNRLWNDLLCGEQGIASVDPVRSLMRLGEAVRAEPRLVQLLGEVAASDRPVREVMEAWPDEPTLAQFRSAFFQHVERYGDRCFEELKLECQSYRIEPRGLIPLVLRHAQSNVSIEQMETRERAIRKQAEAQLRASLRRHPLLRALLAFTLSQARRSIAYREAARLDRARAFAIARAVFRQLGAKLAQSGALGQIDDVFFLTQSELFGYIRGGCVDPDLTGIVSRRRAQFAGYAGRKPADRIVAHGSVYAVPIPQRSAQPSCGAEVETVLRGVPCAPGSVVAEALVVQDPAHTEHAAGRVVVAPMTDPGWVFLMTTAAALVVEKGSILSHTAIIGRELGVPTVVGVAHATERIRSGARVHVDGASGLVTVLAQGATLS